MTPSLLGGSEALTHHETPDRRTRFEALHARDSKELWALAYAACQDSDAAMHCVQQAFTEAWDRMDGPDQGEWLRARVRTLAASPRQERPAADANDTFAVIRRMLAEAPADDREILTLRYSMDYTAERIGTLLGKEPAEVESVLVAQKQRLAAALKVGEADVSAA